MKYRELGRTGLSVSEIGFGAWGIGGTAKGWASYGPTDDSESDRALRRAFDLGVTLYDTAGLYGEGRSERLLGAAFKGRRDKVVLASKAGRLDQAGAQDFSGSRLKQELEDSLRRLQTDYLDLFQLHDPPLDLLAKDPEILETLRALKRGGRIRAFGLSARSPADALRGVREFGLDVVQVNFSMIDQRAVESGLFEACRATGAGVIGRTPLCFGFLTGRYPPGTRFDEGDHRSRWPAKQRELWANAYGLFAPVLGGEPGRSPAQAAIRYCLSYPEVSSVLCGMLTAEHVDENAAAQGPLSEAERLGIEAVYKSNTFFAA